MLRLRCCVQAFSSCGERGLLFRCIVCGASHCGGFSRCRAWTLEHTDFNSYGVWAWFLYSMWDLPRPGIEPMSPTLAGGCFTTGLPGKFLPSHLTVAATKTREVKELAHSHTANQRPDRGAAAQAFVSLCRARGDSLLCQHSLGDEPLQCLWNHVTHIPRL